MNKRTKSEDELEEYFAQEGISYERIKRKGTRTPDYKVNLGGNRLIIELKGFVYSENDKKIERTREFSCNIPLGTKRIRGKQKKASEQLKNYTDKPTLEVLRNTEGAFLDLSNKAITAALFGDVAFFMTYDHSNGKVLTKTGFKHCRNAPSQIVRKNGGSLISAVAILEKTYRNNYKEPKWRLRTFHNPYARVRFPVNVLSGKWDETYEYQIKHGEWQRVET